MITAHPIDPVFNAHSRILILGSFPSVRSREASFYYAHPQNRFWPLMTSILEESSVPVCSEDKAAMLLRHNIALWDVIASCEIEGSMDSNIRQVQANDLKPLLCRAQINKILCNGATAYSLYCKYMLAQTGIPAVRLPSTSPANAAWNPEKLYTAWKKEF